jgi:hypothetical protein
MQRGTYLDSKNQLYFVDKFDGILQAEDLEGNICPLEQLLNLRKAKPKDLVNSIQKLHITERKINNFFQKEQELNRDSEPYEPISADNLSQKYAQQLSDLGIKTTPYSDANSGLDKNYVFCNGKTYHITNFIQGVKEGSIKIPKQNDFRRSLERAFFHVNS